MKAGRFAGRTSLLTRPRPWRRGPAPRRRPRSWSPSSSLPCHHVGRALGRGMALKVARRTWPELRRRRATEVLQDVGRAAASPRAAAAGCCRAGASQRVLHCWHLWEPGRGGWRSRRRLGNGRRRLLTTGRVARRWRGAATNALARPAAEGGCREALAPGRARLPGLGRRRSCDASRRSRYIRRSPAALRVLKAR